LSVRWTAEQITILEEYYGAIPTKELLKKLDKPYPAFRRQVLRQGLSYQKDSGEYLTKNQLSVLMGVSNHKITYMTEHGLKYRRIKFGIVGQKYNIQIKISDLMQYLQAHQDSFEASKIDYMALGSEPQWLRVKRRKEYDQRWMEAKQLGGER